MSVSFVIIICLILIIALLFYRLYKFLLLILDIESGLEKCFAILEERHKELVKISQKEVFFDSIEIRQAISEINKSHEALTKVALILTKNFKEKNETKET